MHSRLSSLFVLACAIPALAGAQAIKRIQTPSLSPDGKTVVFSWQGDLWSVPATGGRAERLTIHPSNDIRPKWFPDGSRIAFASARYGSNDVFTMRPDGSDIQRVTFESASEIPSDVSADGKVVYGYTNAFGRQDTFRVKTSGGDLVRLTDHPLEAEFLPVLTPDGKKVVYGRGSYGTNAWQKTGMVSSALPEIWIADNTVPLSNHRRLTNNERTDLAPQIAEDGTMFYISNASGWPNVWRMNADGKGAKQLTFHTDGTARNPSVSRDGRWVVYEFESELYRLDTRNGATERLSVTVPADARNNPVQELTFATGLNNFAVSPDGKRAVVEIRGDLFLIPEKGGTTRRLTTNPAWDTQATWLDGKTVLYVASENGKRSLKTVSVDGAIKDFMAEAADQYHPQLSPDGKMVAYHRGENEIVVVPAAGGTPKVVLRGNFVDAIDGGAMFSWGPDNKSIVANVIEGRRINVVVADTTTDKRTTVAKLVFKPQVGAASTPYFLPNGKGVYFTSPEFDEFDLYVVDLVPPEITFTEDDLDKLDESPKKDEKKEVKIDIYEPGIEYRLRRLTTNGAFSPVASPDSKTFYVNVRSATGALGAATIPVAGGVATPAPAFGGTIGGGEFGKDGRKLYFVQNGRFFSWAPGSPAPSPIAFNAQYTVNLRDEEMALFRDITWAMERQYYDPKLHNKNWPAIKAKFEKIVPFTYDRSDFYALMGEMMEELESSHLGATAPAEEVPGQGNDSTGLLGVEWDPAALEARNAYVVKRVIPQSAASDPGSELKVGDRVVSVEGVEPDGKTTMATLLNKQAGKRVDLVVERDGKKVDVAIKPQSPAFRTNLEYEAWVAQERALVDKYSGGKLGYVHIRAMDETSLNRFLREIRTQAEGKRGLLIDCRYNGGGSTAVNVLGILVRQPWLIRTTRGDYGTKLSENIYRSDALELPTALMVNTYSFSNAEIIAEGFRSLKRGPIIGERTPGYVIGTGGYQLWDGGFIRMPSIGAYTVNMENLENNGRRPDFTVWFDPNAWTSGEDPQLQKAVQELLKQAK